MTLYHVSSSIGCAARPSRMYPGVVSDLAYGGQVRMSRFYPAFIIT